LILENEVEVPTAESPMLPADEPQSPVHRFPIFNSRNTSGSSSTPPSASSSEEPRRMRNLEELYDATLVIEDTTLFCFFTNSDPLSFNEAVTEEKWIEVMDKEMHAIEKNDTWKLTNLPENQKAIGVEWVYKTKKNAKCRTCAASRRKKNVFSILNLQCKSIYIYLANMGRQENIVFCW
jgi:hypothetical protein